MSYIFLLIATIMHVVLADNFNSHFLDSSVITATSGWNIVRGIESSEVATSSDSSRYTCSLDS